MSILHVQEEPLAGLTEHAKVPIAFEVRSVLEVESAGAGAGFRVAERAIAVPRWKDYDAIVGASPALLGAHFDLSHWALLVARDDGERVGGAVLAFDTQNVDLLEGRTDLAVVWDLRVSPTHRRQGVGTALWRAAEAWARARGCRQLKVETQDVNVPACRFYARQGCVLRVARREAYPDQPGETQLLWYEDLVTS